MADYEKINWRNGEEGGTPTSAANFRHMDHGIATAQSAADAAQRTADGKADPSAIPDVSGFVTQSAIDSAVEGLASSSDIPDVSGKADKSEIPDVSALASQSALDVLASRVAALETADSGE